MKFWMCMTLILVVAPEAQSKEPAYITVIGKVYQIGRSTLMKNGYRPLPQARPQYAYCKQDIGIGTEVCRKFPETDSCGQGGEAPCRFEWIDPKGKHIHFITHSNPPLKLTIVGYSFDS